MEWPQVYESRPFNPCVNRFCGAELKRVIRGRAVGHGPGHIGQRRTHREERPAIVDGARSRHRLIEVVGGVEMLADVAHIRRFEQQRPRKFLLDRQIELFGIPGLIVRINADHAAAGIVGKGQVERRNRRESRR